MYIYMLLKSTLNCTRCRITKDCNTLFHLDQFFCRIWSCTSVLVSRLAFFVWGLQGVSESVLKTPISVSEIGIRASKMYKYCVARVLVCILCPYLCGSQCRPASSPTEYTLSECWATQAVPKASWGSFVSCPLHKTGWLSYGLCSCSKSSHAYASPLMNGL